ncbi:hypothetical protein V8G54_028814 [Vigna mungo]|uniref:Uncharacterized protein n=1 Tax=Vigna mungo TaxID=3915 RepID=A0AAQ3RIJ2_VIGMU
MSVSEKAENTTDNVELAINVENKVVGKEDEVCVCRVPKSLISGHPEAFSPHFVGLGPYHHRRLELTMTKDLKLAAASRIINYPLNTDLADVESFYHEDALKSYANEKDKLIDDIITDGKFVLALLNRSLDVEPQQQHTFFLTGKRGMPLVNTFGVELTIDAVIRDVFMLENQIPTRVLHQINQANTLHGIQSDDFGAKMLAFCEHHCPLVHSEKLSKNPEDHAHLLDLMYHLVAPMPDPQSSNKPKTKRKPKVDPDPKPATETTDKPPEHVEVKIDEPPESGVLTTDKSPESSDKPTGNTDNAESPGKSGSKTETKGCCSILSSICFYFFVFFFLIGIILWYLLVFIWKIVYGVLHYLFRILKKVSEVFLMVLAFFLPMTEDMGLLNKTDQGKVSKVVDSAKNAGDTIRRHFFEEKDTRPAVTIQSVTELDGAGFHFKPANSIKDIKFDMGKKELLLPVIHLDENSEVIMRNLMAYESLTRSTYLIFTRYIEIMRAIIDIPEDVKLLVKNEIIVTDLSDKVVTDLFNGMSISIRPTETSELEEEIKKVKMTYEQSRWLPKMITDYVYSSWKIITVIAALSFFVLTTVQTVCSVYDCASYVSSNSATLSAVSGNGLISSI